jgi:hypothetical protein
VRAEDHQRDVVGEVRREQHQVLSEIEVRRLLSSLVTRSRQKTLASVGAGCVGTGANGIRKAVFRGHDEHAVQGSCDPPVIGY